MCRNRAHCACLATLRGLAFLLLVIHPTGVTAAPKVETSLVARMRYEGADGAFLGPPVPGFRDVVMTRGLLGLRVADAPGDALFLQLGWHDEARREPRALPTDVNRLDLHQAYLDVAVGGSTRARLGRQELVLGSARLVGTRDAPNIRRSFDGVVVETRRRGWQLRTLALTTVEIEPGAFDDQSDPGNWLAGLYATRGATEDAHGLDLYALWYQLDDAPFGPGRGHERRWSWGLRTFGESGPFDHNVEVILQTGGFGAGAIRAWTIASDLGFTLPVAGSAPRLGLKANITSGDRDPADARLETFNPLFPNLAYFSDAATIAPQNHSDVQLSVGWRASPTLTLRVAGDVFWRTSAADAVYRANGTPIPVASTSHQAARQLEFGFTWTPSRQLEVRGAVVDWRPADSLVMAGSQRTRFVMLSVLGRAP
jgi:hypothetical protein